MPEPMKHSSVGRTGLLAVGDDMMVSIEVLDVRHGPEYQVRAIEGTGKRWVSTSFIVLAAIETNAIPGQVEMEL